VLGGVLGRSHVTFYYLKRIDGARYLYLIQSIMYASDVD
jgi:hypothetical protein